LKGGVGRFGWSYAPDADLRRLARLVEQRGWDALSDDEKGCYQEFLLEISPGDYVVYVNLPQWGRCTLARVTGEYYWDRIAEDFNHCFRVDAASVLDFDRNDALVHPALAARLKLQGRYWRIYCEQEFDALLAGLSAGKQGQPAKVEDQMAILAEEVRPHLGKITEAIHHTHPNFSLERLLERLFRRLPGVRDVRAARGRADMGADLIVVTEQTHPLTGEVRQSTILVQVKSFEGVHDDPGATDGLRKAFGQYREATEGVIASTAANSTAGFEQAVEKLRSEIGKPISVLMGNDLAAFVLRHGWDFLR
jgi:hypothetical protein